jgi:hypothetical protein
MLLDETGAKLSEILGEDLPDDAIPSRDYAGNPRIIVPTVRTSMMEGETVRLKVIILDNNSPQKAELFWRPMGTGEFRSESLNHVNRGVYSVELPSDTISGNDIEYYIQVIAVNGESMYFPSTAPELNQTVVVLPGN